MYILKKCTIKRQKQFLILSNPALRRGKKKLKQFRELSQPAKIKKIPNRALSFRE